MRIAAHRREALWFAFALHRLSGLALAIFLPVHFLVLGLALSDPAALDGFLKWSNHPLVGLAEGGLVFLLAVHMFGGLRLMALEFLPWSDRQKSRAAFAVAAALFAAGLFLLGLF